LRHGFPDERADGKARRSRRRPRHGLAQHPDDQRGWQAEKKVREVPELPGDHGFRPTHVAQRCDFCGSAALIPVEDIKAPIRPESLLQFKIAESEVRDRVRGWYGNVWFAPSALQIARADRYRARHLSALLDLRRTDACRVDRGERFTITTRRNITPTPRANSSRARCSRRAGSRAAARSITFFNDELVPASKGVTAELLAKIEPFPTTTDLKPYDPGFLSGWVVEQYQIDLVAAAETARGKNGRRAPEACAPSKCRRHAPVAAGEFGLLRADLQARPRCRCGCWLTPTARNLQVVINGYTGVIGRQAPVELGEDPAHGARRARRDPGHYHDRVVSAQSVSGAMNELTTELRAGRDLDAAQIENAVAALISPEFTDVAKADFLQALRAKGETAREIAGFVQALLARAVDPGLDPEKLPGPMIDICGTGGDKLELFNISTTAMFVSPPAAPAW